MNPLIPGLGESGKMSSSEPNSKIDFIDSEDAIKKKVNKAFCVDGVVDGNGLMAIMKYIIFRRLNDSSKDFVIDRPEKYGGKITFKTYEELETAFVDKKLSSVDLKQGVANSLCEFLAPLNKKILGEKELVTAAYPDLKL
jgi:tyrosyl-tRNA synthetase